MPREPKVRSLDHRVARHREIARELQYRAIITRPEYGRVSVTQLAKHLSEHARFTGRVHGELWSVFDSHHSTLPAGTQGHRDRLIW